MHSPIKLGIDNPCNESWEKMTPSNAGNYCNSCKKTVIDFTGMSDKEVYQFMQQAGTSVCGRFNNDQLNKVLTPAASATPASYHKSVWQLLVAGSLFASEAKSQQKSPRLLGYVTAVQDSTPLERDMFRVVDSTTKEPLQGASIIIDRKDFYSDEKGFFRLNPSAKKITISYIGYAPLEFQLKDGAVPKTIALQPSAYLMDEVSVFGMPSTRCTVVMGGATASRVITKYQKVVRSLKQWIPDLTIKAFPNPIIKGQLLNVQLSLPPGAYAIKVFAADGKLVDAQSVQVSSGKQSLQIPISLGYASGTYWLHVQDYSGKQKRHEVKFIIK